MKSKIQKIGATKILTKTILAGTVVALKVDNAEKRYTAENMAKVLTETR